MKYRCISYPDFEPNHTWLRQILLFVDEVHRIVPANEPLDDSDDLKQLLEHCEGSVLRCSPEHYVEISSQQAELFGRALDQPSFRGVPEAEKLTIDIGPSGQVEVKGWEFLHIEKIGARVSHELESRGMVHDSPLDQNWKLVPRGVGGLVLSMLADQIAEAKGFDAVTDQPLAFALNSLHECGNRTSALAEGVIASAIATVHVPRDIGLLSAKEFAELRKHHKGVRTEFSRMVRELKDSQRLDRIASPTEFRRRLDDIVEDVGEQMKNFRRSKAASKINDWVPIILTSLVPVAVTFAFGPIPGVATGLFSFSVNSIAKLTKRTAQFSYPEVLQTLCAANEAAASAAIRRLRK
jgi:hypothetical protein